MARLIRYVLGRFSDLQMPTVDRMAAVLSATATVCLHRDCTVLLFWSTAALSAGIQWAVVAAAAIAFLKTVAPGMLA